MEESIDLFLSNKQFELGGFGTLKVPYYFPFQLRASEILSIGIRAGMEQRMEQIEKNMEFLAESQKIFTGQFTKMFTKLNAGLEQLFNQQTQETGENSTM